MKRKKTQKTVEAGTGRHGGLVREAGAKGRGGALTRVARLLCASLLAALIASCSLYPDLETDTGAVNPVESGLTQRDYLALLKTRDSHKVSVDELQKIVSSVLTDTQAGRSAAPVESVITGVRQLPVNTAKRFVTSTRREARSAVSEELESEPVEIYEFSVGQPGADTESFVLGSTDDRIGNILAITVNF